MHALGGKGQYSQVQAIIDISYYLKDNTSQRTKEGYALVNSKWVHIDVQTKGHILESQA